MWISETINVNVQRNAVTPLGLTIYDIDNNIVDLSEYNIACEIAQAEGEAEIITIFATNFEPTLGKFDILIDGESFSGVSGATEEVRLAYNILATDSGANSYVVMRGAIILTPGV